MAVVARYVRWIGHDAGGTLPSLDVAAGILAASAWLPPTDWPPLAPGEALVLVPPQWIGDWETGSVLPPGYQHVWRVPLDRLAPPPDPPLSTPYRPTKLPPSACGPSLRSGGRRPATARADADNRPAR